MQSSTPKPHSQLSNPIKACIAVATLGAVGILSIILWTASAVRKHISDASLSIFPAALNSEKAAIAFVRMKGQYNEALRTKNRIDLEDANHEALTAISALAAAGHAMAFKQQRQRQILSLQHRIFNLQSQLQIDQIPNNRTPPTDPRPPENLFRGNDVIEIELKTLQNDLASDFRDELSFVNRLLSVQEILEMIVRIAVIVALFFCIRSWVRTILRNREDEILDKAHLARGSERNRLRSLIDNIPDFVYVKDIQSRFLVANVFLAHAVGLKDPEELLGKTDFDFFPAELAEEFFADEQQLIRSGIPLYGHEEKLIDSTTGKEIHYLTTKVPLRDTNGEVIGIAGIGHNITERKWAEDTVREAERKYREIFDEAIVGIFQTLPNGRILTANPAMATLLGYSSPEEFLSIVGSDFSQIFANLQDRDLYASSLKTMECLKNFECEALCKDGKKIWMSSSIRVIRQNEVVVRHEGMSQDITERKFLQCRLLHAQKLESVGQLAAGIAHEINTPAQYIGDNVRFLKDIFPDLIHLIACYEQLADAIKTNILTKEAIDAVAAISERIDVSYLLEEIPKAIEQAFEGINRISTLINAMKEFSHPGTKNKIPMDLNHAIQSTITVSRTEWKYIADMETSFDSSLPPISCQPDEFNQVILNLIVNAAHAIADKVKTKNTTKGLITIQTQYLPPYAEIRIQDTGSGIPEGIRSRIFDPFFTTKEIGKGTGQGLAIARSVVVDHHQGTLEFETEEGKGTTFIINLPVAEDAHMEKARTQ